MKVNNKQIFIEGKPVTEDYLLNIATELTSLSELIQLVRQPLEMLDYSVTKNDEFVFKYYILTGGLQCLENNLEDIQNKILKISNNICPDEM